MLAVFLGFQLKSFVTIALFSLEIWLKLSDRKNAKTPIYSDMLGILVRTYPYNLC